MKRLLVVGLLAILSIPLFSQQLTPAKTESTTCFSDSELAAFEEAVKEEMARAVMEAIKPYAIQVERKDKEILFWKVLAGVLGAGAGASLIWAAVK